MSGEWIPVDVAMPKEHKSVYYDLADTEQWKPWLHKMESDYVLVTVKDAEHHVNDGDGSYSVDMAALTDGKWNCDYVIAWMPLPEPYIPSETSDTDESKR